MYYVCTGQSYPTGCSRYVPVIPCTVCIAIASMCNVGFRNIFFFNTNRVIYNKDNTGDLEGARKRKGLEHPPPLAVSRHRDMQVFSCINEYRICFGTRKA